MNDYNRRMKISGEARIDRIKRMRQTVPPMTMQAIADLEGVSKQRIFALLKKGRA